MNRVSFRALTENDLRAARKLWSKSEGVELSEGDSSADLKRYLRRNPRLSFAAFSGRSLVGAVLAGHDGRRGFLYHLAVSNSHQGLGIGRELVQKSLLRLRRRRIRRVLILVAQDNTCGRAFWLRRGWEPLNGALAFGIGL